MSFEQGDYYQVLELNQDASAAEIEEAYERVLTDLQQTESASRESDLSFLLYVYEVLSNPQRRKLYDSLLVDVAAPKLVSAVKASNTKLGLIDTPQIVYLLVEIRSGELENQKLLPLNLCLVVDCSTSMRGERLEQAKNGLYMLLDKLSAGDVLSLVKFSDRAQVIMPAQSVGAQQEPVKKIQALQASGGTEIYQGLSVAVGQMKQMALGDFNNHIILLTDGHTYGDESKCLRLAARLAEEGITLSAYGIGADWDDQFLDNLVRLSGGHSEYIAAAEDIVSSLESHVRAMGSVFAHHVQLRAKWPPAVELLDSFRLTPFAQPLQTENGRILLGDVEEHIPLRFLLEFSVVPQPIPIRFRISLKFAAEIPDQEELRFKETVSFSISEKASPPEPPVDVVRAVRLLSLFRLNEKAWREAESGHLEEAAARMTYLSTRLLEVGETALAKQAGLEAQRLSQLGTLSPGAYKDLKYGTRALMGKTIQWEQDDSL